MLSPFNRSIHLWLLAFAFVGFTYFGVQAVLFNLYLLRLGYGPQFIGLLVGSGQVIFALAAIPAGQLGQRAGVRGAFCVGLAVIAVAFAMLLCVEAVPRPWWVAWLVAWWALFWAGGALANVNSIPYAMSLAGDDAPRAFAVQSAVLRVTAFAGSVAAGPLLSFVADRTGASAADPAPYRSVMWLVPLVLSVGAAVMLAAQPAPRVVQSRISSASGSPMGLFMLLGVVAFLFTATEGTVRAFFNVYLDARLAVPPAQIGATMGLGQLLPVGAALAVPAVMARFGTVGALTLVSLVAAASLVALATLPILLVAGLAFMLVMSVAAMHGTIRSLFSQEMVGEPWRTTTAAILTVGMGLGWASSAAVGGLLLTVVDFPGLFFLAGSLAAIAAAVCWWYERSQRVRLAVAS
jgi:predicted MFS family arabinose efflux permease